MNKDTVSKLLTNVCSLGIPLLYFVITIRTVIPEQAGKYNAGFNLILYLLLLTVHGRCSTVSCKVEAEVSIARKMSS